MSCPWWFTPSFLNSELCFRNIIPPRSENTGLSVTDRKRGALCERTGEISKRSRPFLNDLTPYWPIHKHSSLSIWGRNGMSMSPFIHTWSILILSLNPLWRSTFRYNDGDVASWKVRIIERSGRSRTKRFNSRPRKKSENHLGKSNDKTEHQNYRSTRDFLRDLTSGPKFHSLLDYACSETLELVRHSDNERVCTKRQNKCTTCTPSVIIAIVRH